MNNGNKRLCGNLGG
uniref:Uncharacterized protein n=1 Tax=Arundo donax TaxID=35708 RepID=A0A0A9FC66_ARUDO